MDRLIIGCGYLGRRVAALWRERGDRVFAVTRSPARVEELRQLGLQPVVCDVLDVASLRTLPAAATVLHAVGLDRTSGQSMRDVYVQGLANVLDVLAPPERFIYVSSSSVYGQTGGEAIDEDAPTEPQEESGRIVREAERLLRERLPAAVILRFAGIYGPGRLLRRQTIEKGEPIVGDGEKWLNLIHVDDGAAVVVAAAERAHSGATINVSDDLQVRRREFYTQLAHLLGAPEPRFVAPSSDAPLPPHERANRRLVNRRMYQELGVKLRYRTFKEGLMMSCKVSDES